MQEYRSLPILIFYLSLATALALNALKTIYVGYKQKQKSPKYATSWKTQYSHRFTLFAILSILSLSSTWYYMFSFFALSYRNWRVGYEAGGEVGEGMFMLELWLRETKLFREAWETVSETGERSWWSGQIFLWTVGWSVFLGLMGRRYKIPHVWTYMLLGQIVAISFAQNLFFTTILVHSPSIPSDGANWIPPSILELVPIIVSLLSAVIVPHVAHTPGFLLILFIPHLLLFVPTLLRPGFPARGRVASPEATTKRYVTVFKWIYTAAVAILAHSTYSVFAGESVGYAEVGKRLLGAVYEHPAVSSVSWDVVFCTTGVVAWVAVNRGDLERCLR